MCHLSTKGQEVGFGEGLETTSRCQDSPMVFALKISSDLFLHLCLGRTKLCLFLRLLSLKSCTSRTKLVSVAQDFEKNGF